MVVLKARGLGFVWLICKITLRRLCMGQNKASLGTAESESDWNLEQEFNYGDLDFEVSRIRYWFSLLSRMCLAKCQILSLNKYSLTQDGGKQKSIWNLEE